MKSKLLLLPILLIAFNCCAQTWTIHAFRDNFTWAALSGEVGVFPCGSTSSWIVWAQWDSGWDQAYPEWSDSGYIESVIDPQTCQWIDTLDDIRYSDYWSLRTLSTSTNPPYNGGIVLQFMVSAPYPNDGGRSHAVFGRGYAWPNGLDETTGGEAWIDYSAVGNIRVVWGFSQPLDFGKWAWDGSINPSWVEPVAPLQKKHGKGHTK